jgi:glycerophosphoryl diester phosphodiesterase
MDTRTPAALVALLLLPATMIRPATQGAQPAKQNIAHRGASAYAPEHTLAAYQLALEQGADFVEQDLAVTKDGELICLHDDTLDRTTDVASVFPNRFVLVNAGARGSARRWLANDFTLAEVGRLDAGSWFGPRWAGQRVPTFQEAIDLVRGKAGLYPELKSPPLYTSRGVDMVALFVAAVKRNGLDRVDSLSTTPLIVQSFDEATIRRLAVELPAVPRVWLLGSAPEGGLTSARLDAIARFATGIGPARNLVAQDPDVVARAHAAGLTVTAYTFASREGDPPATVREEMAHFLHTLGGDAVFTNNPDRFPRTR